MVKSVGLLLLFFCCAIGGTRVALYEKRKIDCGEGLIQLIQTLKRRAEFFRAPPESVFADFENSALSEVGFLSSLRRNGLEEAIMQHKDAFCFTDFSFTALLVFTVGLGKAPLAEHIASCDYILGLLQEESEGAKEEFPKKQKLYVTLGIALGLLGVILFL